MVCESGQFFPESSVNASVYWYSVEPFVLLLTEWIRIRISNLDQVAEYGINLNPDPNSNSDPDPLIKKKKKNWLNGTGIYFGKNLKKKLLKKQLNNTYSILFVYLKKKFLQIFNVPLCETAWIRVPIQI